MHGKPNIVLVLYKKSPFCSCLLRAAIHAASRRAKAAAAAAHLSAPASVGLRKQLS